MVGHILEMTSIHYGPPRGFPDLRQGWEVEAHRADALRENGCSSQIRLLDSTFL